MYWNLKEAVTRLNHLFPDAGFSEADLLRTSAYRGLPLCAGFYCRCYSPSKALKIQSPPYLTGEELVEAATVQAEGLYFITPIQVQELELKGAVIVDYAYRGDETIKPFTEITTSDIRILQSDLEKFVSYIKQAKKSDPKNKLPDLKSSMSSMSCPSDWQIIEPTKPDALTIMIFNALHAIRREGQPMPKAAAVIEYLAATKPKDFIGANDGGVEWFNAEGTASKHTSNGEIGRRINRMTGKTAKK